jgi:hypothetical protein
MSKKNSDVGLSIAASSRNACCAKIKDCLPKWVSSIYGHIEDFKISEYTDHPYSSPTNFSLSIKPLTNCAGSQRPGACQLPRQNGHLLDFSIICVAQLLQIILWHNSLVHETKTFSIMFFYANETLGHHRRI